MMDQLWLHGVWVKSSIVCKNKALVKPNILIVDGQFVLAKPHYIVYGILCHAYYYQTL